MSFAPLLKAAPFSGERVRPFQGIKQYLSTGDLQGDDISLVEVTFDSKPSRADIVVRTGDVLFARMKGTKKVLRVTPDLDGTIVSTGFAVVRPNENCNANYLAIYLGSEYFEREKTRLCSGAIQPAITNEGIQNLLIPCPPITDQIRIAHLLGKVEGLIAQRKQHLQQLDDLLNNVFLEMFGDPAQNKKEWGLKQITDVCDEIVDCVNKTAPQVEEPTPFIMIRTSNIRGGLISLEKIKYVNEETYKIWTRRSKPRIGDILFTREAPMGESAMIDFDDQIFLGQRIMQYRCNPNASNPKFILELMKTRFFQQQVEKLGKGSTVKHLTVPDCFKFKVIAPPISIQNQFASIVEKIEATKSHYRQSLADLETLYAALSQSAFHGELDLSCVPLPAVTLEPAPMENTTAATVDLEVSDFRLPDLGLPIAELANETGWLTLLTSWLEAWQARPHGHTFVLSDFLDAAQSRLIELYPKDDLELGMAAYEQIKDWVFNALDSGSLVQGYDEDAKRITLRTAHA